MFKKKDNHNIPKDYDKSLKKSSQNQESSVLVGSAHGKSSTPVAQNNTQLEQKKAGKVHKLGKSPKIITLVGIVVIAVVVGAWFAVDKYNKDDEQDIATTAETTDNLKNEIYEKLDTPPADTESAEVKEQYYRDTLWLKTSEGDDKATVDYYKNEVLPKNIVVSLDIKEALVLPLISTGNIEDSKRLIAEVKSEYQQSAGTTDPIAKDYIDSKINYYTTLEQSL